jgi:hypothetical protein
MRYRAFLTILIRLIHLRRADGKIVLGLQAAKTDHNLFIYYFQEYKTAAVAQLGER